MEIAFAIAVAWVIYNLVKMGLGNMKTRRRYRNAGLSNKWSVKASNIADSFVHGFGWAVLVLVVLSVLFGFSLTIPGV